MTRMQLGMINYENVSTIVDSMTHKSGDPAASNQENGEQKGGRDGGGESRRLNSMQHTVQYRESKVYVCFCHCYQYLLT